MGADGGVVHVRLRNPSPERYRRVVELLGPFWQFLSEGGRSDVAEEGRITWENDNPDICSPAFLVGCYGTDGGDSLELDDLKSVCSEWARNELYLLTFADLDLECRTATPALVRSYDMHPLHRLWISHFDYDSREVVLRELGPLAGVVVGDWVAEMNSLIDFSTLWHDETWT